MAGVGVKLNRIFERKTLAAHLYGYAYSAMITVAPMLVVIGAIALGQWMLGFSSLEYFKRELFSDTLLYIFIFSLLAAAPLNAVLSRYLSDVIFLEKYEDIMPAYYVGLALHVLIGCAISLPFCVHEYLVGGVALYYVATSYCCFMALVMVFYSMLFLSIAKDYMKITVCYSIGMAFALLLALALTRWAGVEETYALLLSLTAGFLTIAALEFAIIRSYFRRNSREYRAVFRHILAYRKLVVANLLYTVGLFVHNFVFWTTDLHTVLVKSFVTVTSYDMATCIAMFTNISSVIIFNTRLEMYFHDRYKAYSEAVIGGRGRDIRIARNRLFRQAAEEIMSLVRTQFIITVVLFLLCIVLLPQFGFGGTAMQIYPCLCVGYFILFIMYAEILLQYYFNDITGAMWTSVVFCLTTLVGTIFATRLNESWYGIGLVAGAFVGFTVAYFMLRRLEKTLDAHTFCRGSIIPAGHGIRPSGKVFDRRKALRKSKKKEDSTWAA